MRARQAVHPRQALGPLTPHRAGSGAQAVQVVMAGVPGGRARSVVLVAVIIVVVVVVESAATVVDVVIFSSGIGVPVVIDDVIDCEVALHEGQEVPQGAAHRRCLHVVQVQGSLWGKDTARQVEDGGLPVRV